MTAELTNKSWVDLTPGESCTGLVFLSVRISPNEKNQLTRSTPLKKWVDWSVRTHFRKPSSEVRLRGLVIS